MNCTSCGTPLPVGVAFCPTCGAPAPSNTPAPGSSTPYAPTEASSYGNQSGYPSLPPTVAASSDNYGSPSQNPYTDYGVNTPSQTPYNPYNTPSGYPGGLPPPPTNQPPSGPYGTPPNPGMQPNYTPNMQPGYAPNMQPGYAPGMQPGTYGMPPKKKSKVGWIIGIILLVVFLLCGGILLAVVQLGKSAVNIAKTSIDATATAAATDSNTGSTPDTGTTATTSNVPTNSDIVPAAANILFGAQTSSTVDKNYDPQHVTSTFATNKDVNLTFQVNSAGKDGYIKVKWYEDGQQVNADILKHSAANNHVYFAYSYDTAGAGAAAMYWCTQADCSDAQLAQIINFTITSTGAVPSHITPLAVATTRKRNNI